MISLVIIPITGENMYICKLDVLHTGSNMPCNGIPPHNSWSEHFNSSRVVYGKGSWEYGYYRAHGGNYAELRVARMHNWGSYNIVRVVISNICR